MKAIKSGSCIMGIVGTPTPMTDLMNKPLFVGDLVRLFYFESDSRISVDHGLTYVADGNFSTYVNGKVSCSGVSESFMMGIRACNLGEKQSRGGYWHVKKVKRYNIPDRKGLHTPHTIEEIEMPVSFMRVTY